MKTFLGLALLVFTIVAGWRIGSSLNSDALGMALGMFLGILAGIPTAILLLLSTRRQQNKNTPNPSHTQPAYGQSPPHGQAPYSQPPVIIVAGPNPNSPPYTHGASTYNPSAHSPSQLSPEHTPPQPQQQGRKFRVVGESEEWLDEW